MKRDLLLPLVFALLFSSCHEQNIEPCGTTAIHEMDYLMTHDVTMQEIEQMNKNAEYPLEVDEMDDGTVTRISGKYTKELVNSEETALLSICSVRSLLHVSSPKQQLELIAEHHDEDSQTYSFQQYFHGIKVYGRTITVGADNYGHSQFLQSSLLTDSILESVTEEEERKATAFAQEEKAEILLYSLQEYERHPVFAYCVSKHDNIVIYRIEDDTILENFSQIIY